MGEFDPRKRHGWVSMIVLPTIGTVVVIGAWWLVTVVFDISKLFLPAPPDLIEAFVQPNRPMYLLERTGETVEATLIGFAVAMVGGFVIAVMLSGFRALQRTTLPVLVALNAVPKVALAPLLVVWLGFEMKPKIVMVILICFFPIVVATMSGLASTPADLGELIASLSASRWQAYLKVRVPWALPQIFVGLKVSVPLAVIGTVVAETNNPNTGLGSAIVKSTQQLDTSLAFACLILLALLSTVLFYLVVGVEWLALPWARAIAARKR
jgi:NitT/TauT family transport system permease protein